MLCSLEVFRRTCLSLSGQVMVNGSVQSKSFCCRLFRIGLLTMNKGEGGGPNLTEQFVIENMIKNKIATFCSFCHQRICGSSNGQQVTGIKRKKVLGPTNLPTNIFDSADILSQYSIHKVHNASQHMQQSKCTSLLLGLCCLHPTILLAFQIYNVLCGSMCSMCFIRAQQSSVWGEKSSTGGCHIDV